MNDATDCVATAASAAHCQSYPNYCAPDSFVDDIIGSFTCVAPPNWSRICFGKRANNRRQPKRTDLVCVYCICVIRAKFHHLCRMELVMVVVAETNFATVYSFFFILMGVVIEQHPHALTHRYVHIRHVHHRARICDRACCERIDFELDFRWLWRIYFPPKWKPKKIFGFRMAFSVRPWAPCLHYRNAMSNKIANLKLKFRRVQSDDIQL